MEEKIFLGMILGILFSFIYDIVLSIINFIDNETWLVPEYEKIIYYLIIEEKDELSTKELDTMNRAMFNYIKSLERELKRDEIKLKIKSFFKRGE